MNEPYTKIDYYSLVGKSISIPEAFKEKDGTWFFSGGEWSGKTVLEIIYDTDEDLSPERICALIPEAVESRELEYVNTGEGHQPGDKKKSKRFLHWTELDQIEPVRWLIPGLVPSTGITVYYGKEGVGKSFFALSLANTVAAEGNTVLYIPYEDKPVIEQRQKALADLVGTPKDAPLYFQSYDMPTINDQESITAWFGHLNADGVHPDVVIIDTFRASTKAFDENSTKDAGMVLDSLESVKDYLPCSVVVVHHAGKDTSRGARGSSVITSDADLNFEITCDDLEAEFAQIKVECNKNKFGSRLETEYWDVVKHMDNLAVIRGDGKKRYALATNQAKVYACLDRESPKQPKTIDHEAGISNSWKALQDLIKKGYVSKLDQGYIKIK